MKDQRTFDTVKAGMQNFQFKPGDVIVMNRGEIATVTKVENTTITIGPSSMWQKFKFWLSEQWFEIKMFWWRW